MPVSSTMVEHRGPGEPLLVRASDGPSCRSWTAISSGSSFLAQAMTPKPSETSDSARVEAEHRGVQLGLTVVAGLVLPGPARCRPPTKASAGQAEPARAAARSTRSTRFSALVPGTGNLRRVVHDLHAVAAGRPRGPGRTGCSVGSSTSKSSAGRAVRSDGGRASLMTSPQSTASMKTSAAMPTRKMTRPSGTGPSRPMPPAARVAVSPLQRLDVGDDRLLLLRGELVVAEDRHVLRAGQHRGVDLSGRSPASSDGAYLPEDSAPPRPAKSWQDEQLSRNSSPPRGRVVAAQRQSSSAGISGPPPSDWMYAPMLAAPAVGRRACGVLRSDWASWPGQRHPAGADLELDRGRADADQARARGPARPARCARGR